MSLLLPALALLTAIAVAAILWPLFRRQPTTPRSSFEIGVYRDQLAEVERDRARGLIGADEAKAARLEIERRILRTAPIGPAAPERTGESGRLLVLGAALLVPVLALGLYAALGTPGLPDEPIAARNEPAPSQQPDIQAMVARLQERLEQAPDDREGWLMLGRSRGVLGDGPGAVEAFRRALALAPDDPRAVGGLGEALVASAQGVVTPEARGQFQRLLELTPDDPRGPYYLGWAEAQAGDYQAALARWQKLLAVTPADAPWRGRLIEGVREAAADLKLDPAKVLAAIPTPPARAAAAQPGAQAGGQPSAADKARAAAMTPEQREAMIRGMVEKLQARMDADGSDPEGWLRLAQARLVLNQPDQAQAAFEQGLRLHPDDPALLKGYAASLLGPEQAATGLPEIGDQAAQLYRKVAELRPDDPEPWWYLGIRALQEGDKASARASWEKVLARLDPAQPEYAEIKERLDQLGS